ncbi:MAG: transposase zinc-binding domain-containing protein, partial [Bacteroidales bacterium]|nr:transposase zinc-binding domain-containing protein [Bacteroidales bacterium]
MENKKQKLEIADIFRKFGDGYSDIHNLHPVQTKAFNDIINCRSAELGGHIKKCDHCGHTKHAYNSCRNRHCPKCQYIKQVQWVDKLKAKLPPTRHFHLVFTIPQSLHKLFYLNQAQAYKLLFKASAMALKTCAANPKFLGAQTGAVAVLHTWGQTLNYHPHIHMIVPAGGLSE